jgi:hypothetical protein
MKKQKHEVITEFVIVVESKGSTGEFESHEVTSPEKFEEIQRGAIAQAQEARNGEWAIQCGAKYGVIKRTTIVLEEFVEPLRAAGWVKVGDEGFVP